MAAKTKAVWRQKPWNPFSEAERRRRKITKLCAVTPKEVTLRELLCACEGSPVRGASPLCFCGVEARASLWE